MRLDQLCFHCVEDWQAEIVKGMFGLQAAPWIEDHVKMLTRVPPSFNWHPSTATLLFNESLGIQLEIMRVTGGPSWVYTNQMSKIFISHIGLHLDENEDWPVIPELVQESKSTAHSAPAFHDKQSPQYGRRYHYRIHRMPYTGNVYLKLIKRLHGHD